MTGMPIIVISIPRKSRCISSANKPLSQRNYRKIWFYTIHDIQLVAQKTEKDTAILAIRGETLSRSILFFHLSRKLCCYNNTPLTSIDLKNVPTGFRSIQFRFMESNVSRQLRLSYTARTRCSFWSMAI